MKPGQLSGSDVSHIIEQEHSEAHYQKQQSVKMGRNQRWRQNFCEVVKSGVGLSSFVFKQSNSD